MLAIGFADESVKSVCDARASEPSPRSIAVDDTLTRCLVRSNLFRGIRVRGSPDWPATLLPLTLPLPPRLPSPPPRPDSDVTTTADTIDTNVTTNTASVRVVFALSPLPMRYESFVRTASGPSRRTIFQLWSDHREPVRARSTPSERNRFGGYCSPRFFDSRRIHAYTHV